MLKLFRPFSAVRTWLNRASMACSMQGGYSYVRPRPQFDCVGSHAVITFPSPRLDGVEVKMTVRLDSYDCVSAFWVSPKLGAQRWVLDVGDMSTVLHMTQQHGQAGLDRVTEFLQDGGHLFMCEMPVAEEAMPLEDYAF